MSKSISTTNSEMVSLFNILTRAIQSRAFPRTGTELQDMLKFQGKLLKAGGKLLTASGGIVTPPVDPPVTLPAVVITPAAGSFRTDLTSGTAMATVSAVPAGATRTLTVAGGVAEFNADKTQIRRSSTGALSVGPLSVAVTDTHPNATNSPRSATASLSIVAPPVTLPAISLTAAGASFQTDVAAGTLLATVSQGVPAGATRAFTAGGNVVVFANNQTEIRRGTTGTLTAGSLSIAIADTHPNATNSPRTASATLTITAPPVVVDPPVDPGPTDPPPAAGDTIVAAKMAGTGAPAGTVQTFGQGFQRGHLMPSDGLVMKLADGSTVATQFDSTATLWDDGSIRLAAVHVALPALADGAVNASSLAKAAAQSSTPINLGTALAGRTCTITVSNGANTFSMDRAAIVAALPAARWWSGALATQARITATIPRAAVGGGTDATLVADITSYADGSIAVDAVVWNRKVFAANQGDAAYTVTITGEGGTKASRTVTKAPLYTGLPTRARWKADGTAVAFDAAWMTPVPAYLARTGLTANHDAQLGVLPSLLSGYATAMAAGTWNTPYNTRGIYKKQGEAGGRPDIGETTGVNAAWLITGDKRAQQYGMGQAEAALGIPWHCWDDTYGRWVNPIDRPYNRTTTHDGSFTQSSDEHPEGANGKWQIDGGHWGDHFAVPYFLTARRCLLDGLLGQASYAIMSMAPEGFERGEITNGGAVSGADTSAGRAARRQYLISTAEGAIMTRGVQIRSGAWMNRQINWAAIAPASEQPHGDLFRIVAEANYARATARWPALSAAQGPVLAGCPDEWTYDNPMDGDGAPWQVMMLIAMHIRATRLGFAGAIDQVERQGGFLARILQNQTGWWGADATQYNLHFGQNGEGITYDALNSANWSKSYAALRNLDGTGNDFTSFGDNYSAVPVNTVGDYERRAWAVMNQLRDLLGDLGRSTTEVDKALAQMAPMPKTKTFTENVHFQEDPATSVVRIGQTRAV